MLNTLRKVEDHENHVRWMYLTTVLYMRESPKYAKMMIQMLCDYQRLHEARHILESYSWSNVAVTGTDNNTVCLLKRFIIQHSVWPVAFYSQLGAYFQTNTHTPNHSLCTIISTHFIHKT